MKFKYLSESKEDIQKFVDFFGKDIVDRFYKVQNKFPVGQRDLYRWMHWGVNALKTTLARIENTPSNTELRKEAKKGAELIYSKGEWLVYKINTSGAASLYGKDTQWCINREAGNFLDDAQTYWDDYVSDGSIIYIYIHKDFIPEKYALLIRKDGSYCVYDEMDRLIPYVKDAPEVKGLPNISTKIVPWFMEELTKLYHITEEDIFSLTPIDGDLVDAVDEFSSYAWQTAWILVLTDGVVKYFYVYDQTSLADITVLIEDNLKYLNESVTKIDSNYAIATMKDGTKFKIWTDYDANGPQTDCTKIAYIGDNWMDENDKIIRKNLLGYLQYAYMSDERPRTAYVQMLEVKESMRRKGIGTALIQALQKDFKPENIRYGYSTDDGTALLKSMGITEAVEFSSDTDSEGNRLTPEQLKFFKDSKIRDSKGRLLVCYHGTDTDFDEFNADKSWDYFGFHFGTLRAAQDRNPRIILPVYLNIKNPLIIDTDLQYWDAVGFMGYFVDHEELVDDFPVLKSNWGELIKEWEEGLNENGTIDDTSWWDVEYGDMFREALYSSKYDGIIYTNYAEDAGSISYMAFRPDQIKSITNKTPTRSANINENVTEGGTDYYSMYGVDSIVKEINNELEDEGFEIEFVKDYDFEDASSNDWVGVFCQEYQDNASVFPVTINFPLLIQDLTKENELDDIAYHIKKTLWHEVGHGIYRFLDLTGEDEERLAEEYADFMMGDTYMFPELLSALEEYNLSNGE